MTDQCHLGSSPRLAERTCLCPERSPNRLRDAQRLEHRLDEEGGKTKQQTAQQSPEKAEGPAAFVGLRKRYTCRDAVCSTSPSVHFAKGYRPTT